MARRASAGVAASLVVCALFACSSKSGSGDDEHDDNNFRGDVIECEDALERLERCCPDFDAKPVLCNFFHSKDTGCGSVSTNDVQPALDRDESACIRDRSCDSLVATKVCERAQLARAYESHTQTPIPSSSSYSTPSPSPSPSSVKQTSSRSGVSMKPLLRFAPLVMLFVSSAAHAQDLFAPSGVDESAPAPTAAPAPGPCGCARRERRVVTREAPSSPTQTPTEAARAPFRRRLRATSALRARRDGGRSRSRARRADDPSLGVVGDLTTLAREHRERALRLVEPHRRGGRGRVSIRSAWASARASSSSASIALHGTRRWSRSASRGEPSVAWTSFATTTTRSSFARHRRRRRGLRSFGILGTALGLGLELGVRGKRPEAWTASAQPRRGLALTATSSSRAAWPPAPPPNGFGGSATP